MNQELEQRVNELVLENNGMSHADALRQVQTELAEEEVKKKDSSASNSGSSDGTFEYIGDAPLVPLTERQQRFIDLGVDEGVVRTMRSTASSQEEADALNFEYEGLLGEYNEKYEGQLQQLSRQMLRSEDPDAVVASFQEQSGVQLDDETLSNLYGFVEDSKEEERQFLEGYEAAQIASQESGTYEPIQDFLEASGVSEEQIAAGYNQWSEAGALQVTIQDLFEGSVSLEKFNEGINSLNIEEEEKQQFRSRFEEAFKKQGEDLYKSIKGKTLDTYRDIRDLNKKIEALRNNGDMDPTERERRITILEQRREGLQSYLDNSRDINQTLREAKRQVPQFETAMSLVALAKAEVVSELSERAKEAYSSGRMNLEQALIFSHQEREYETGVRQERPTEQEAYNTYIQQTRPEAIEALVESGEFTDDPLDILPEVEIEGEADVEYIQSVSGDKISGTVNQAVEGVLDGVDEVLKSNLIPLTEGMDKDQIKALENAVEIVHGRALDLDGDGLVGTGETTQAFLITAGGLIDLFGYVASAPAHLKQWVLYNAEKAAKKSTGATEDELKFLEQYYDATHDEIESVFNFGLQEAAMSTLVSFENDWKEDLNGGNYLNAWYQAVNKTAEMAPDTILAIGTSLVGGPLATSALFYTSSMVRTFNDSRKNEWYKNMTPFEIAVYLNGVSVMEAGSEALTGAVGARLLSPSMRLLGQSRGQFIRSQVGNFLLDTGLENIGEIGNTIGQAAMTYYYGGREDLSDLGDEIADVVMTGSLLMGGTRVVGGVNNTVQSALSSGTDINRMGLANYFQANLAQIMAETEANSQARSMALEALNEEMGILPQLQSDSYQLHQFINESNSSDGQKLVENSAKMLEVIKAIESSTSPSEIKSLRLEAENLVKERQQIESNYLSSFATKEALGSIGEKSTQQVIDSLNSKAEIFDAQVSKLREAGLTAQADSLSERSNRLRERARVAESHMYVDSVLAEGGTISSENRKAEELAEIISSMGMSNATVDAEIASQLEEMGYSEVKYDGSSDSSKLMVKGAKGVNVSENQTKEQALSEARFIIESRGGNVSDTVATDYLLNKTRESENGITSFNKELLSESERSEWDRLNLDRISNRKAEDLSAENQSDVDSSSLSEASRTVFDNLAGSLKVEGSVRIVTEEQLFRDAYNNAVTAAEKEAVLEQYLRGDQRGGYYQDHQIVVADTASAKDIIEEFAHAVIHQRLHGIDRASKTLKDSLKTLMLSDPAIAHAVSQKISYYRTLSEISESQLEEEMFVEIFAQYVSRFADVSSNTKSRLGRFIDGIVGDRFSKSGGSTFSVMEKLSRTIANEYSKSQTISDQFEQIFTPSEEQSELDQSSFDETGQANLSAYRRRPPTFLDNKTVKYAILSTSRYTGLSEITQLKETTFNDYFHFVNWYRKMTGNGRKASIAHMQYVDDNGNVKRLNPPKPLLDKTTGEPVYMEASLKSFEGRQIERSLAENRRKAELRKLEHEANMSIYAVRDQLHPIIEESMLRSTRGAWAMGNTTLLIRELMDDYVPGGVEVEGKDVNEKALGSPEFHEELLVRVNEYLDDNYPGSAVLFSARKRASIGNMDLILGLNSKQLTPKKKRENIDGIIKVIKDTNGENSPIVKEVLDYVDGLKKGTIGGAMPRPLVNALITALDTKYLSDTYKATRESATEEQLLDAFANRLTAINEFFDFRGSNFFENAQRYVDLALDNAGYRVGRVGESDNFEIQQDPEVKEFAQQHRDLLIGIIAITSNGNKADVNFREALAFFNIVMNDLYTDLSKKRQEKGWNKKKESEWLKNWYSGLGTLARIEQVINADIFETSSQTPNRADNVGLSLEKILERYDFSNPGSFSKQVNEPVQSNDIDIASQRAIADGGYGPKIGAFMANLMGNSDVFTQDVHVVESMNRVFRPQTQNSVNISKLLAFMEDSLGMTKEQVRKIAHNPKTGWLLSYETDSKGRRKANTEVYDSKKVFAWLKGEAAKRDGGVCTGNEAARALRKFYEGHFLPETTPKPRDRRQNKDLASKLAERIRRKPGYENVSAADVGQMIFLENHILQNALGVSNRAYEDFSGEAVAEAINEYKERIVANPSDLSFTSKTQHFAKMDPFSLLENEMFNKMYPHTASVMAVQFAARLGMNADLSSIPFFSARKRTGFPAMNHPQGTTYLPSELFKGRQVSSMSNVRLATSRVPINKMLEGRAADIEMKSKVSSFGKAEDFEGVVDGVLFMRNPLYSEAFVDVYGNRLKSAEKAVMSGDIIIASGNIKMLDPYTPAQREDIDISSPEHFVAFQNYVSIMKQRNNSLMNAAPEMFEMAYQNMTAKERARFANLTVDEHGNVIKGRRLRGTSKRVAGSSEFARFKNEIINNPNNYIDRQKIADEKKALEEMSPQELVSLMRGDALNNLATRNDDVGVLAGIELINRLQAEGNDIGIVSVLDQLAAVGTTAGRVLRHMAELKTSSPQGMASVIIKKAEGQGKILSEAQKKEILDATKEYMRAYRMVEDFMERGIAGEDVENLFKRAQEDLSNAERDLDTLANKYVEKSWAEIGQQLVQGNLLTMMSQARNVVYNVANIIPKTVVDIMSMPTSKAFELLGLHKEQRKLSLAAYLYAMRKFGAGTVEAIEQVITGREKDMSEWRMSRGFMPIRSLMHAMSTDLPEGQTMRDEFNQRAKLLVQGTFGIPAEAMFRLLSLGDVPFRRFAEGLELYNIGRGKGLEGEALAQFLKFPDKDSADVAATEGRKLTFQEPMGLARGSMWIIDNISRGMGQAFKNVKGFNGEGFFKFLIRLNVPYVSTIANFTEETLVYASPVFGGGKMAIQMGNGEYTEASKTLTKVMVGQAVSTTALYLISQGLLSGSVDWEDDEKTNLMYDTFPPNSINVSGLRRLLNGEDPSPQAGDEFRSYQTLGVFGTIMGAYAHSTTPEAAKEMAEQPFSGNNALKKLFGFDNVSVVAYMMDQSFLQGLNGITSVIASTSDPDDFERAFFRYVETISKAFSSMFLPNVLSGVDQATREFLPDKRDKDLADRIKNHVRERTFNTGGLPVKVNWKGERIEQAPVGGNQFAYYMFDATKKREASQDEVSLNILNLYLDTGVLTKAVGTPYYASSVYRKLRPPSVSRGKAKKAYAALGTTYQFIENPQEDFFVRLTAEEINNALEMTNTLRYNDIQAFMQTEEYQGMTNNEKIEALDDINDRYKSLLSYNPDGSFMEHSKYILGIMERRYLEQYGQD